ncbi:hypothetical protein ABZ464_29445 [Streptomyces sp. NPDC005820]|uniref:hypothetical protein n=1 Tax=Streptomyces sp. NPDC005820 TaxID=3157069 RepID=UPI0033EA1B6A
MIRNRRKAFLVSAALLGGALPMTACDQGSDATAGFSDTTDTTAVANTSDARGVSGTGTICGDTSSGS